MGDKNKLSYLDVAFNQELLRRIERLEQKVIELQDKNKKLEEIVKETFISFKFKEGDT